MLDKIIFKNISSLFSLRIAGYIIPLITLPYLVRVLGAHEFGIMSFSIAFVQYFITFVNFGFDLSATKKVSEKRNDKEYISKIFANVVTVRLIFCIIGFVIIYLVSLLSNTIHNNYGIIISAYLSVIGVAVFPQWLFQGKEKLGFISIVRVVSQLLTIPLLYVFVKSPLDTQIATLISSLPFVFIAAFSLLIIYKNNWLVFVFPTFREMKKQIKDSYHFFISNAAGSLYTTTVPVVLGFVSNPTSVAIYTTAHKLVFAAQGLYSPITTAMFPRISLNYAKSHDMAVLTIKKLLKVTSILGGVTSISIITLAPHAINLLFGEGYEQSIVVMMILSPLPLVVSLGNVLGIQTLIVFGYKKQFMNAVLYVGMFSLIFLIPISYYWQSYGAAICVVFSELLISLSMLYLVKKNKILI